MLEKSFNELMKSSMQHLLDSETFTNLNLSRGGVVRSILEAINVNIADYYRALDINTMMGFVSTASGTYLDLCGTILDCHRETDEDDENYRYRITQQVYVASDANAIAIRLQCLSIEGVRDIVIKEFTHGTGSFSVYVIPQNSQDIDTIVPMVQNVLNQHCALGVRAIAVAPKMIPVSLHIKLIYKANLINVAEDVRRQIEYYIEDLSVGEEIVINEIIQRVMDTSDSIKDVQLSSFTIDGVPSLLINRSAYWNEKFYPDNIIVS